MIKMNKEHIAQLVFGLFVVMIITAVLLSSGATSAEINGGKKNTTNSSSNITYVQCVTNASVIMNSCFNSTRITAATCRTNALNAPTKNPTTIRKCGRDYSTDYKKCQTTFKNDKKTCQKLNHTFYDEVTVAKYG